MKLVTVWLPAKSVACSVMRFVPLAKFHVKSLKRVGGEFPGIRVLVLVQYQHLLIGQQPGGVREIIPNRAQRFGTGTNQLNRRLGDHPLRPG